MYFIRIGIGTQVANSVLVKLESKNGRGQVMIEYLVISSALVFSLMLIMDHTMSGQATIEKILELRTYKILDLFNKPIP